MSKGNIYRYGDRQIDGQSVRARERENAAVAVAVAGGECVWGGGVSGRMKKGRSVSLLHKALLLIEKSRLTTLCLTNQIFN
jgi:hypothetical protein